MRFRFADERNALEGAQHAATIGNMDAWWHAFSSHADRIDGHFSRGQAMDVPAFMHRHLAAVDPRLMWEFGPARAGGRHRLVITPDSDHFLRPLTAELLRRAPQGTGFEFYEHRLAEPVDTARSAFTGRTQFTLDGWSVCCKPTDDFGIDLTFVVPTKDAEAKHVQHAAFVAAEALLGQSTVDTFVDRIAASVAPPTGLEPQPLHGLARWAEDLIDQQQALLPSLPLLDIVHSLTGSILELKPKHAPDFARQDDLWIAKTVLLPMWKHARNGALFSSKRFSRAGETFCYLKTDGSQGIDPAGFQDKAEIEDALEAVLTEPKLGALVGGGTGLRYSYVDLALLDVQAAIPLLREALQAGRLPKRSWLMFFDSALAAEWVGVWDDSPPPPLLPE